jgi:dTDP-glucose 4,6-dehydratase
MGAETHVDKSIENPEPFVVSNVVGTMHLLEFARTLPSLKKFIMFSTDEVYGPAPLGVAFKETDRYNSTNPYAGTKAGAEQLALAYANTYKVPVIVTNTMNVFGERQHPEKFIPLCVRKILAGETITIHASPDKQRAGSRFWIHARNVASAVMFLLENGQFRESYNIVGEREVDNLNMAKLIAIILGKDLYYDMVDFHSSRPGHDLRYALDGSKMRAMGWELPLKFEESLEHMVRWTLKRPKWLNL